MSDTDEKSAEQTEREELVKEQQQELLEQDLNLSNLNSREIAHQRWLETGQTEPEFMYPETDGGDGGDVFEDYKEGKFRTEMEKARGEEDEDDE